MSRQVITKSIASKRGIAGLTQNEYSERLLKLIPAEVVSVYIAVFNLIKELIYAKAHSDTNDTNDDVATPWFWAIFVILGVGNFFYMMKNGVTDWKQFLIATIAYILWVCSIGGPVISSSPEIISPQVIAAIIVPVFTLFIPIIYK